MAHFWLVGIPALVLWDVGTGCALSTSCTVPTLFLGELGASLAVRRNDKITIDEVVAMDPDAVVLSPGP